MTPFQKHQAQWQSCNRCELSKHRNKVVLARGTLPADLLFCGEAPGPSEDVIGRPFVGPAGLLLDKIISDAVRGRVSYCITNLVACIPRDDRKTKFAEPSKESIAACQPRLIQLIRVCRPKAIVLVGRLAEHMAPAQADISLHKNISKPNFGSVPWLRLGQSIDYLSIIHPAAILRMDVSQRGLAMQRSVLSLEELVDLVVSPRFGG
jgi:DNA polymerase